MRFDYDVIVVGGGHAGCEAASAAARMGAPTLLITMDMTKYASMSCNPAVGGVAKGQIVREIDAMGGRMGIITDLTTIQFRMLNRSKGPAMWSPRAQCDKQAFAQRWREELEHTANLYLWQGTVERLIVSDDQSRIEGVVTQMGVEFRAKSVILTTGTFMGGLMHIGRNHHTGGRAADQASTGITEQLVALGFEAGRMKTGTPARIDIRTVDTAHLATEPGDEEPEKFSFWSLTKAVDDQMPCYLVYTSPEVHDTLRTGFADSPLFNGTIHGIGPRYCPSIEDKLRTFAGKESHQLFLEPEGRNTNEYYLNGFSSSLPWDVQIAALQKIEGMEEVAVYRPGYAIEYDYFPPTQLRHTLETKRIENLYFAGQINGTTGYEEAAAQGLMAGINAVRKNGVGEEVVLSRDQAYIGVLIDDLVTKGVDEPYRMFTSRAEYRILLRQGNADRRLTPLGRSIGLVDERQWSEFEQKIEKIDLLNQFVAQQSITTDQINPFLESLGTSPITQTRKLSDLIPRNEITIELLSAQFEPLQRFIEEHRIERSAITEVETDIKYRGYTERERVIADKLKRLDNIKIPASFDFNNIKSLTIEARQKLSRINPSTIGQASRIPGVSPADINVLLIHFGR